MSARESTENLELALSLVENTTVREELFQAFHLVNPIDFARLLDARGLSIPVKAKLLSLKVAMPPVFKSVNLQPLIEDAMKQMWTRLAAEFPSDVA